MKVLFLVKSSNEYGTYMSKPKAGLFNSARQVVEMINYETEHMAFLESCIDGNDVDNKLAKHQPHVCIIEAIWITPTKMEELVKLHPLVMFVIRVHSKIPFLAMEGTALTWIKQYNENDNIFVSFNNEDTSNDMNAIDVDNFYLPNVYNKQKSNITVLDLFLSLFRKREPSKSSYAIGCFGAIRPMKNQLNQAVAAMEFCNNRNAVCLFYVNAGRVEQSGDNVLKNLRALFKDTPHTLVELSWYSHEDFLKIVKSMDMCMQVSFTESFNIVTADCVSQGIPIVVSKDIDWLKSGNVDPNSVIDMVLALEDQVKYKDFNTKMNLHYLDKYNKNAMAVWIDFLNSVD